MADDEARKRREFLKRQLAKADEHCKAAGEAFATCMRDVPTNIPQPDGIARLQRVGRAYLWALSQQKQALEQFTDSALEDEDPMQ
jgi:hypothetical protein